MGILKTSPPCRPRWQPALWLYSRSGPKIPHLAPGPKKAKSTFQRPRPGWPTENRTFQGHGSQRVGRDALEALR